MKINIRQRLFAFFLVVVTVVQFFSITVQAEVFWPEETNINSPSAILLEMNTGTILYERNSTQKHYPASITKIMTTMIALEKAGLDEVVTFSDASIDNTEGSGIARDYGEQMPMKECLYAIMLESANECAYAVAEHVAGSIEAFAELMNAKARELGCVNTNFTNPHGLHDSEHYTCSYDMALIAEAAYQNEMFRTIISTKARMIPPTNKHAEETPLQNHNKLLHRYQKGNYVYPYCTGGKTGYTDVARSTLVTYAEKDGMTLVCVVMNTDNVSEWTDSIALFNYGFDNFHLVNVSENETGYAVQESVNAGSISGAEPFVELDKESMILLPKMAEFKDVQSSISYNNEVSNVAGSIAYTYAGREVGTAKIVTTGVVVEPYQFDNQNEELTQEDDTTIRIKPAMIVAGIAVIGVLIVLAFVVKYLYDNIYIIRYNMSVRRERRKQFREIKKRPKRRRRRRRR